ncbi:hypothetical protein B6U91_00640 [Candidatus Pacearchaeota archaeon ex4484_71]|nr:MAG: hypothetical protein B6U91_00640 [Candidatus Pacearchaeota archaeon ex4484_71]
MAIIKQIQLGKKGITENFIENLKVQFSKANNVKISVLSSFCRDKKELKRVVEEILEKLGKNYTAKTIGYTINIKKWRKEVR